jgi:hypothetical protein
MAHWYNIGITDMSFTADVDLTTLQYRFVTVASTAGNVASNTGASNPAPLGVLQNSPSLGQEAKVRTLGPTKIVGKTNSSSPLTYGRFISASGGGQATATASETGDVCLGRWLDTTLAVSSSAIGQAVIWPNLGVCPVSAS